VSSPDSYRINFSWLVRLRWGAITGQLIFIAAVDRFMHIPLPLLALGSILALEVLANLVCLWWLTANRAVREYHVGLLVALDVGVFSALLYFTGGPTNPFSFLYLIHIAIAALVLRPRWMWALVALTLACSGLLFLHHAPLETGQVHEQHLQHGHGHDYGMHLRGMWVALGVAASFIVYFLQRVTRELGEREQELTLAREQTARHERLAALATLAAGAAHELASPLSTIAVVTKELERRLQSQSNPEQLADVRLIREQVERCRGILSQMATDAGEPLGDVVQKMTASELITLATTDLAGAERIEVNISSAANSRSIVALPRPLAQALRSLLENALDASLVDARVGVDVELDASEWRVEVRDSGLGMTPEVRSRAVEPFFTTKAPNQGLGLGLFLTKSVVEQHGGRLTIESEPGRGTRASLFLPMVPPATICRIPFSA